MIRSRDRWATRVGSFAVVATGIALIGIVPAAVAAAPPETRVQLTLRDPRIDEASGIGVGVRSPDVVYVQNDSGDTNRFFALDARGGATVASVTVSGAHNVDWEDLAVAPDADGTPSVWLADTGDNDAARGEVQVYRVDEPLLRRGDRGLRVTTARADVWRLRFAGGPVDTESIAVTPTGSAYLVTKSLAGSSQVYRLPKDPDAGRVRLLTSVGSILFRPTGTADPFGAIGQITATGASMSRNGTVLAVRTYSDAWLWRVRDGDVGAALRRTPTRIALPAQPQGEGIAFDGDRLLVDSEGVGTRVWSVHLPAPLLLPAVRTTPSASSIVRSASPSGRGVVSPPVTVAKSAPAHTRGHGDGSQLIATLVFAVALAVIVGACGANRVRVRRRRRSG